MRSGGATHVVATWPILISGVNAPICMTLGFPTKFQFFEPWFLNFSSSHFTFPKLPIIALSIFFSNLSLRFFFELVHSWAFCIFLLRYVFLLTFCFFSLFGVDINYGEFLIFSPFSFVFVFGFRSLGFLGFILFSLFPGFPWLVTLRLG